MAKFFNIVTRTTDQEGNSSQENVQVKAGESFAEIPEVSFQFPQVISTQIGDSNNPYWSNTVSRGFAFIGVTPTPSDAGTGGFFVQTYYNSGEYPHNPSRQFKDTAKGDGSTLENDWFFSTSLMSVAGGGFPTSGFVQQTDVSGLRPALVISRDTQNDTPFFGDGIRRIKPGRLGARVPTADSIVMAYHHDLGSDPEQLRTLRVVQEGDVEDTEIDDTPEDTGRGSIDRTRGRVSRTLVGWPAGSFIFPHPYHYCPVYENNALTSKNVLPYVLVVEDGTQYPLRGTVSVTGTSVTGSFTKFTQEISGQSVIRFEGDTNWYIVSGVISDSGLVIYDYGEAPSFTNVAAQANRFAIGSGLIEVLPNIAGCSDWSISLSPKYDDGDIIPGESLVYTVEFGGTGAISGTPSYQWTVSEQPLAGGTITTSGTGHTSAGSLEVFYDETKKIQVEVTVSGSAQPICVHSYNTGYLNLKPGANPGTWSVNLRATTNSDGENISECRWFRREGAGPSTDWIHHWQSVAGPPTAVIKQPWAYNIYTLQGDAGAFDDWPDQGSVIVYARKKTDDGSNEARFGFNYLTTYTGKTSSSLTGVNSNSVQKWTVTDNGLSVPGGAGAFSLNPAQYSMTAYYYNAMEWPMTYITGIDSSRTRIKVEDLRRIKEVRAPGGIQKFWILQSNAGSIQINPITIVGLNGFSLTTDELEIDTPLTNEVQVGDPIFPGFWEHWRHGSTARLDPSVPSNQWNAFNQNMCMIRGAHNRDEDTFSNIDIINNPDGFTFAADETLRIIIWNFVIGAMYNDPTYGAFVNNGTLQRIMIPEKGKILLPNVDRTKNLVFEYDGISRFHSSISGPQGSGPEYGATLLNCRLVEDRSGTNAIDDDGNIFMYTGAPAFFYKELILTGEHTIETNNATDPHISINQPGHRTQINYTAAVWYDLVQSNLTEDEKVGIVGTPKAENIWESRLTNWPVGAMAQIDPIYTDLPDPLPPADPIDDDPSWWWWLLCIQQDEYVRVKDKGYRRIGSVKRGDLILGNGPDGDGWFPVSHVKLSHREDSALRIFFANGEAFTCTDVHPLAKLTKVGRRWTKAKNIKVGDQIQTLTKPTEVIDIKEVPGPDYFVDLAVEKAKTFYVGKILVHNKRAPFVDPPLL